MGMLCQLCVACLSSSATASVSAAQIHIALLQYEPTIEELRHKYEAAMKEKMLVKLEKDRLAARSEALQAQVHCCSVQVNDWPAEQSRQALAHHHCNKFGTRAPPAHAPMALGS